MESNYSQPNYNPNIIYHDLPADERLYIKELQVELMMTIFDKNPQSTSEWDDIISPDMGWVCMLGDNNVRVNLDKFGPDRIWITINRVSPTELDVHVVERINGIDHQVL
jgi:hypothetical protein